MLINARFLWVAFQIESICSQKSDQAILNALEDIPKDLPETFNRILRKLHFSKSHDMDLCLRIFNIVIAAQRPFTLDELREAISVEPGETIWNTKTMVNHMPKSLACYGSLLVVNEEYLTVHFAHHSVKQHLLFHHVGTDLVDYIRNARKANLYLGEISVTYLSFKLFSTQITKPTTVTRLPKTNLASAILNSSLPQTNVANRLALRYLKSRRYSRAEIRGQLEIAAGCAAEEFSHQNYAFLSYARDNWLYHTKHLDDLYGSKVYNLWIHLIQGQVNTVELS